MTSPCSLNRGMTFCNIGKGYTSEAMTQMHPGCAHDVIFKVQIVKLITDSQVGWFLHRRVHVAMCTVWSSCMWFLLPM